MRIYLAIALLVAACGGDAPQQVPQMKDELPESSAALGDLKIEFVDIADASGLEFTHHNGATAQRYFPETMSGGGLLFDANADGWLDIYLLNGHRLTPASNDDDGANVLFLRQANGQYEDVTQQLGVGDTGYGNGGVAADLDGDGDEDLYVSNFGADVLYRNDRSTFTDVSASSIPQQRLWSTSCAVLDADLDGDLDIYVAHYVDYDVVRDREVDVPYLATNDAAQHTGGPRGYPHPGSFNAQPDHLLRNDSSADALRFTDISHQAGIPQEGKGLGVVSGDFDRDGWTDLYVANDAVPNHLLRNLGTGRFENIGVIAGVAFGQDGQSEAGMGVDAADYDGDGLLDLTVTNFQGEPNGLYRNGGSGFFASATFASGMGLPTVPDLAFGTNFIDVDNDGRLDLFVGNGHVLDNVERFDASTTYAQRDRLFLNQGQNRYGNTTFADITAHAGSGFESIGVTRGSAVGDVDNDGDSDLLVVNLGGKVALLRNDTRSVNSWVSLRLIDGQRHAYDATASVHVDGRVLLRTISSGRSYLSQSDPRLLIGLGTAQQIDSVVVQWPRGDERTYRGLETRTHHSLSRSDP